MEQEVLDNSVFQEAKKRFMAEKVEKYDLPEVVKYTYVDPNMAYTVKNKFQFAKRKQEDSKEYIAIHQHSRVVLPDGTVTIEDDELVDIPVEVLKKAYRDLNLEEGMESQEPLSVA